MGLEKRHSNEEANSEYLYQPDILQKLDFSRSPAKFS
ncbi:jg26376, partial [Pararge aegeria aegeria]